MATSSTVNIKNLPIVTEVKTGDYLILETESGTRLLDFENFAVTEYNTTFHPTISTNSADITSLKTDVTTLSTTLYRSTLTVGTTAVGVSGLGIGTNLPDTSLHVKATDPRVRVDATTGNHPGFELAANSERKWVIFNRPASESAYGEADQLVFKTNTTEKMTLQQDGKLGIGTMRPTSLLHVSGGSSTGVEAKISTSHSSGTPSLNLVNGTNEYQLKIDGTDSDSFKLRDIGNNADRITVDVNGNISLGNVTPQTTLHVGSVSACVTMEPSTVTPANPDASSNARFYVKGGNFVIQYNAGGTIRYKYLNLADTGVTWTHSTTAP